MTAIATAERPAAAFATDIRSNWTRQEILDPRSPSTTCSIAPTRRIGATSTPIPSN